MGRIPRKQKTPNERRADALRALGADRDIVDRRRQTLIKKHRQDPLYKAILKLLRRKLTVPGVIDGLAALPGNPFKVTDENRMKLSLRVRRVAKANEIKPPEGTHGPRTITEELISRRAQTVVDRGLNTPDAQEAIALMEEGRTFREIREIFRVTYRSISERVLRRIANNSGITPSPIVEEPKQKPPRMRKSRKGVPLSAEAKERRRLREADRVKKQRHSAFHRNVARRYARLSSLRAVAQELTKEKGGNFHTNYSRVKKAALEINVPKSKVGRPKKAAQKTNAPRKKAPSPKVTAAEYLDIMRRLLRHQGDSKAVARELTERQSGTKFHRNYDKVRKVARQTASVLKLRR